MTYAKDTRMTHARKAALARWRDPADPELAAAAKDLEAEKIAAHAQKIIDAWPELTAQQKSRIAILLRPPRGKS